MEIEATSVTRALDEMGVPYTFFQHPGPVKSLEQAAEERGQQPEQIIRSILFRLRQGEYVLVLIAGPQQIDWKALRRYLGQSRVTMARQDEVLRVTGYQVGSVSPFGLPQPIRTLVDESVLAQDVISIGSGVRSTTVILTREDLMQALGEVEIVQLGKNDT
ncbi:MAG TPA: YbaK/EbsC family protein [Anaerolineae bacterium]|nr:YbaK/EbsC family protein [Anaerolineae bacterium]HIP71076.1 YbaK/EbsC family protein [Anaerolineae bacterium]